jgi:phosphoribosylformylglycinamidine (FGAM) synthase PurS component
MSGDINGHENIGHAHRSSYVPNVAKVEVGSVLYLEVEAENNREHGE